MIYGLTGILKQKSARFAVVGVGGFDIKVSVPLTAAGKLPDIGKEVSFYTFLHVREGGIDMYGFLEKDELSFFETLLSVSGIGPKSALGILSVAPVEELSAAIADNNPELLRRSSGVGKKTAERIVVELRDKMAITLREGGDVTERMQSDNDVYDALVGLGYTRKQAKDILKEIDPSLSDVADRLRDALKKMKG